MNKQQSKESLKDKVKGILGLGGPRPPSKQSDFKPSEFIITTDIIRVCKRSEGYRPRPMSSFLIMTVLHPCRNSIQTVA